MKAILYVGIGILIFAIAVPFALRIARGSAGAAAVGLGLPAASSTVSTANLPDDYVEIEGTALLDTTSGTPAVPFIVYSDANGRTRTKQLIFINERGCLPNAGDIPCVPDYPVSSAYPKLTDGQGIIAEGYIRNDRLLVTRLRVES